MGGRCWVAAGGKGAGSVGHGLCLGSAAPVGQRTCSPRPAHQMRPEPTFTGAPSPSPGGKGGCGEAAPAAGAREGCLPRDLAARSARKASQPPAPAPHSRKQAHRPRVTTICPAAGLALRDSPRPLLLQASGRGRCAAVPWVGAGAAAGRWGPTPAGFPPRWGRWASGLEGQEAVHLEVQERAQQARSFQTAARLSRWHWPLEGPGSTTYT